MLSMWIQGYLTTLNDRIFNSCPKHAGDRSSVRRRTGTGSALLFSYEATWARSGPLEVNEMGQAKGRKDLPYQQSPRSQGLASHELRCCQFFWGESCPSTSWMFSTQRLVWILYTLHLPFPSDLRVACLGFFGVFVFKA